MESLMIVDSFQKRLRIILRIAENTLELFGNKKSSSLINIEDLVKKMGGTVITTEWYDPIAESAVIKTGNKSFIIRIEKTVRDRRFRIAQGLGQLIFLYGYLISPRLWDMAELNIPKTFNFSEMDPNILTNINYFAYALVMPEKVFKETSKKYFNGEYYDIRGIAKEFNVATELAYAWGKVLGVFEKKGIGIV